MCGFLGKAGREIDRLSPDQFSHLNSILRHRGPDDFQEFSTPDFQSFFWRLSIVDRVNGKQPFSISDAGLTILFNGEIYNYREIKKELVQDGCRFTTESDTEVALVAYQRYGLDCFSMFEGMYAICIIDAIKGTVFLARDRLGVKPLFFTVRPGCLTFCSEQKALVELAGHTPSLDAEALKQYWLFQTIVGNRTMFRDIQKVPPGFVLGFDLASSQLKLARKIESRSRIPQFKTYDEYREFARSTILKHSRWALDTDLPITFHLSGGIDSNTLIAICKQLQPERKIQCVSSVLDGEEPDPEIPFIEQSAKFFGAELESIRVTGKSFLSHLDDVIFYLDEPVGDPGVVAQFLVNEAVSKKSKIVFAGQGFDELFFGYVRDLAAYLIEAGEANPNKSVSQRFLVGWEGFMRSLSENGGASPSLALFRKLCRFDPFQTTPGISPDFMKMLQGVALEEYVRLEEKSASLHDFILNAETQIQLPSLLHMEDRASMRYSVESRVPFCDAEILDLARATPLDWKFIHGQPKGIIRDVFSDLIPPHILARTQKVGRPIPYRKWLANELSSLEDDRDLFRDLTGFDILAFAQHHPNPYDRTLWGLFCVSRWMALYKVTA